MRLLSLICLSLFAHLAMADAPVLAGPYGSTDTMAVDFGATGEFYARTRIKNGVTTLTVHVTENTSVQYTVKQEAGQQLRGFKLLPQRRFAYVIGEGEGSHYKETLYVVHLSARSARKVFTAGSIRFSDLVPANQLSFQVLVDRPGKHPQTHLLEVDYVKGDGDTLYKLPGRCNLHSNADGLLAVADCVDSNGVHQYLRAPDKGKNWLPMTVPKSVRGSELVGLFLNGDALFEKRPREGGARLLRLSGNEVQELSVSQSRTPDRYLRSFDLRVIMGAVWLAGDPAAEILDITHPDVSRYLEWTIKHSNSVLEVLGRSFDQRLTLVSVIRPDRPRTFELWHRDEALARQVGADYRDAYAPAGLNREGRQLALRDGRLRDGFVTRAAKAPGRLAVVMTHPAPSWGFSPFSLSLANQGFDVLELGARFDLGAADQASDLIDALKWARNLELGDARPACLFAESTVLAAAAPKLYALATDCLVAMPEGRLPLFADQAEPLLQAAVGQAPSTPMNGAATP